MKEWVDLAKVVGTLAALIAGAILYFAPNAKLEQLWARVDRAEINEEILFQKKVIMMLRDKCEAGQCKPDEKQCYEEAQHRLDELREEKKRLEGR